MIKKNWTNETLATLLKYEVLDVGQVGPTFPDLWPAPPRMSNTVWNQPSNQTPKPRKQQQQHILFNRAIAEANQPLRTVEPEVVVTQQQTPPPPASTSSPEDSVQVTVKEVPERIEFVEDDGDDESDDESDDEESDDEESDDEESDDEESDDESDDDDNDDHDDNDNDDHDDNDNDDHAGEAEDVNKRKAV